MITKNRGNPPFDGFNSFQSYQHLGIKRSAGEDQQTLARVCIQMPETYRSQPVLSRLVADYGLTVNMRAAVLQANGRSDGWFDLELWGTRTKICSALSYLDELEPDVELEVLPESLPQEESTLHAWVHPFYQTLVWNGVASKVGSPTQTRIKIQIPSVYQRHPIISQLTSNYGLTVNITGALLEDSSQKEGMFDLELYGTPRQIQDALGFLQKLNVKIWGKPNPIGDSW